VSRKAAIVAAGGLAAGLLAGCISFGPGPQQPDLSATDLPGTWMSGDGASMTFAGDNTFTAIKFDYGKAIPSCGVLSGSGTWQLHNPSDDYPPAPAGTPTNLVDVRFTSVSPLGSCLGFLEMTSWDTGSTPGLCVQMDPDIPCDGYVFTKR
jgi:hypothetical protein